MDELQPLVPDSPLVALDLGQPQGREQELVADLDQGGILQRLDHLIDDFIAVHGQQPLIEAHARLEGRLVAKDHVEEGQLGDVLPDDRQAHGHRRGQQQSDRPPEPGPEDRRGHHRHGRDARAAAVEHRLHHVVAEQFEHDEEADDAQGTSPALEHRDGEENGHRSTQPRADVGQEAQHRAEQPPQQRVGQAHDPEEEAHGHAVAHIDDQLHEQVAADPATNLIEGLGGHGHAAQTDDADEPVAHFAALEQHEYDQDEDQAGGAQRGQEHTQVIAGCVEQTASWLDDPHRNRLRLLPAGPPRGGRNRIHGQRLRYCGLPGL